MHVSRIRLLNRYGLKTISVFFQGVEAVTVIICFNKCIFWRALRELNPILVPSIAVLLKPSGKFSSQLKQTVEPAVIILPSFCTDSNINILPAIDFLHRPHFASERFAFETPRIFFIVKAWSQLRVIAGEKHTTRGINPSIECSLGNISALVMWIKVQPTHKKKL